MRVKVELLVRVTLDEQDGTVGQTADIARRLVQEAIEDHTAFEVEVDVDGATEVAA